jgi:hypothetical protein
VLLVVPAEIVLAICYPYKITQRWPLETVTDIPLFIAIGPTLMALYPVAMVTFDATVVEFITNPLLAVS